jgi:uncharacterized Zn-binding protein involved in type VI secretion
MNKETLKELVKNILGEEAEYKEFFKKALDKAGKSIPDMSDDEKKAFFTKIDTAWDGKGEKKNEGNTFGAERAKAIAKGDDSFKVDGKAFKVTGVDAEDKENAEKFSNENTELPAATLPSSIKSKLSMAVDKIKDSKLSYNQKVQVVGQVMDSLGIDKSEFAKMSSKLKGAMGSSNEGNTFGAERAKAIAKGDDSFKVDGKPFKVTGVDAKDKENAEKFSNESIVKEASEPLKLKGIKINKKSDITFILEISFLIGEEVVISYLTTGTQQDAQKLKSKIEKAFNAGKIVSPSGIGYYAYNESVMNEEKYTVIDPKGNQMGASDKMQATSIAKKKGGEKAGYFVVSNKNALKARRALEKFKGDFTNPKLKDMMADLFYESVEEANTISEPGEWVAYLSMTRGKKLLNTFNTARGAKQFLSKNVDKLLSGANVESVGIMSKKQWDEREAKYAIEGVNEAVDVKAGGYRLVSKPDEGVKLYYGGKVIATGFYDMDDWYFWMKHSNWKGSDMGFNNPKEIINYFRAKKITTESVNEAAKPTIKVVNKLKNEEGIQIVVTKTTDGETMYGGFVVRGKLQKVIPVGANSSKEGVQKRALQIWDEFGKQLGENINEGNAFGMAVTAAKKEGLKEFEFNGKMYKVKQGSYEKNEAAKKPVVLSGFTLVPEKKK